MSVRQFETQLQLLDDGIRHGLESVAIVSLAQQSLNCLVPTSSAGLFVSIRHQQGPLRLQSLASTSVVSPSLHGAIESADSAADEYQVQPLHKVIGSDRSVASNIPKDHVDCYCVTSRRSVTDVMSVIVVFEISKVPDDRKLVQDAVQAIADCLFSFATKRLVESLQQQHEAQSIVNPVVYDLLASVDAAICASRFVERAAQLISESRVAICSISESACSLVAVSGTSQPDSSAAAVRLIEQLSWNLATSGTTSRWFSISANDGKPHPLTEQNSELQTLISKASAAGVNQIRCEVVKSETGRPVQTVLIERFSSCQVDSADNLIRTLIGGYQTVWDQKRFQTTTAPARRFLGSPLRKLVLLLAAITTGMVLIPADFDVEVKGQLFPEQRRRIFAPDQGLIEEVLVESDQRVDAGTPLVKMRNPERDLELNRVLGDIETATSRLQAIRTSRPGTGSRTPTELSELGSEEQQLEQKLKSLREEQALIEKQIESLTLTAPIAGIVYQRRLQEQLTARPVQRGQMLLEIGDDSGGWQVELIIPDAVAGYVRRGAGGEHSRIEFLRTGELGTTSVSEVTTYSLASHLEDGELGFLAFARVPSTEASGFRPGESVTARIACGRRSLGFVWFRELVEFVQKKRFAWF